MTKSQLKARLSRTCEDYNLTLREHFIKHINIKENIDDLLINDSESIIGVRDRCHESAADKTIKEMAAPCKECEGWFLNDDLADHDTEDNKDGDFDGMCKNCIDNKKAVNQYAKDHGLDNAMTLAHEKMEGE